MRRCDDLASALGVARSGLIEFALRRYLRSKSARGAIESGTGTRARRGTRERHGESAS